MESLSHSIEEACRSGNWKPIRLIRNGPEISHLMFADDVVLFVEASTDQANCARNVLG